MIGVSCPACLAVVGNSARFCGKCGAAIGETKTVNADARETTASRSFVGFAEKLMISPEPGLAERVDSDRGSVSDGHGRQGSSAVATRSSASSEFDVSRLGSTRAFSSVSKAVPNDNRAAIKKTIFVTTPEIRDRLNSILRDLGTQYLDCVVRSDDHCLLERVRASVKHHGSERAQYLVIVGGWNEIPPIQIKSPLKNDDEAHCLSDIPYGVLEDTDLPLLPCLAVSRIPVVERDILNRLFRMVSTAMRPTDSLAFAISAECWRDATAAIADAVTASGLSLNIPSPDLETRQRQPAMLVSPEWDSAALQNAFEHGLERDHQVLLFNVHGSAQVTGWFGEGVDGKLLRVFGPGLVSDYRGAIIFSEACYGGALDYGEASVTEDFFRRGGSVLVGSSNVAYGSNSSDLGAADLLAKNFLMALSRGSTVGEAMSSARIATLDDDPRMIDYASKTVLTFTLFGLPWMTIPRRSSGPFASTNDERGNIDRSSFLSAVRGGRSDQQVGTEVGADRPTDGATAEFSLASFRATYRKRLSSLQRSFLGSVDERRSRLRSFRDYDTIRKFVADSGADPEGFELEVITSAGASGYRLHWSSPRHASVRRIVVLTDEFGVLQKVLTSR